MECLNNLGHKISEIDLNREIQVMGILFIVVPAVVALGLASFIHRARQHLILTKELHVEESLKEKAARQVGLDGAVAVGVSVFDVLYNTIKLNPYALRGMTHLHHASNFENLGDLIAYMKENIIRSSPGDGTWRQMVHKYKGYTGEEIVFDNLSQSGHDIDIPDSGTAEGLDVIVDGEPYNIKVTDSPGYIRSHLEKHPDIDVITNSEMTDAFGDDPRVIIDNELFVQDAFHETAETFEGMTDLGNLIDSVPLITLGINMVRNGHKLYKGDVNVVTAMEHTALDTAAVGIGGSIGGKAGLAVGLCLAPFTGGLSAVIIPATTTLLGSLGGILTGKRIVGWVKSRHLRSAIDELNQLAVAFKDEFLRLYSNVVGIPLSFFDERINFASERIAGEGVIKRTLFPSMQTTFFCMATKRLQSEQSATHKFYDELRDTIENAEPNEGGMILYAQGVKILNEVEPLPAHYAAIDEQIKVVEMEKRKLK